MKYEAIVSGVHQERAYDSVEGYRQLHTEITLSVFGIGLSGDALFGDSITLYVPNHSTELYPLGKKFVISIEETDTY